MFFYNLVFQNVIVLPVHVNKFVIHLVVRIQLQWLTSCTGFKSGLFVELAAVLVFLTTRPPYKTGSTIRLN